MNLDFKKAFNEVFELKYFWVYAFIYSVLATLSTIFNTTKGITLGEVISNIFSICTFISIAYIIMMIHNLINDNKLNNENENFWQNLGKSIKLGFKAFVGVLANILIIFLIDFGAIILWALINAVIDKSGKIINSFSIISFALIILITVIAMLFIVKLLVVAFSQNYSIKDMFKWRKVSKVFFKKGLAKKTCAVLGIYLLTCILLSAILLGILFLFNLGISFFAKTLLENHYLTVAILVSLSGVILPFVGGFAHFMLSSGIYNMLAKIYKEGLAE